MDLRSPYPYWLLKHGIVNTYPSLNKSIRTEIAIIGAGITGALVAYYLCKAGFQVTVVDRRHVGQGSTAASTALLQYEIDTPLHKLVEYVGERNAVRSYQLCLASIHTLGALADKFSEVEFRRRPSLQYASYKKHVGALEQEFNLRKRHKISVVRWLDEKEIEDKYGFRAPGGLYSGDAAEMDAYRMTHALLAWCMRKGTQVYDNTEVVKLRHHKRSVELKLQNGDTITARKLIVCCGYESGSYLPKKVEQQRSTYAIVSEPILRKNFWHRNSLIWETAEPYLYLRTTSDNRILIGGKDDMFYNPDQRDASLPRKKKQLEASFQKLFPHIPFKTDFAWAGTFCGTKDGLPYIGGIRQRPHTLFALGFGGNGITFSLVAAEMIRDQLLGKTNEDASIFAFDR